MRNRRFSPKTSGPQPLPGSLCAEYARCGKAACRCARGARHGPYFRRYWRENDRTRREYIRAADLAQVREALAAWRALHPPLWRLRVILAELERLMQDREV
jgi:hypothetical protein